MMSFSLILEYREIVTQKDIYGGNLGSVGRWIGAVPGAVIGYGIGHEFDHGTYGSILGTGIGAALGGQVGKQIGRYIAPNPDSAADFNNPLHRTGYLAMPTTSGYGIVSDIVMPNPLITSVGSHIYNSVSDNGIKKLGYKDPVSKVAEIGAGPFIGLVPPNQIKKIVKKISK